MIIGSNLRARLSTALALNIENSQREMTERMASLLPDNKKQLSVNILPRREPFEILYRLNCDNLCADFHEDLEFRFSWGITALINRFAGKQGQKLAITNYPQGVSNEPNLHGISQAFRKTNATIIRGTKYIEIFELSFLFFVRYPNRWCLRQIV